MDFELVSDYKPTGDQPEAIAQLTEGVMNHLPAQTLLGVTGSGKTFTLAVEYIKQLILNPRAYRHILAVTFTNKATAEMKERILQQLYGNTLNPQVFHNALMATARKRGTERYLAESVDVFDEVEYSPIMQNLWTAYQRKYSYAANLNWKTVMAAVRQLYACCKNPT